MKSFYPLKSVSKLCHFILFLEIVENETSHLYKEYTWLSGTRYGYTDVGRHQEKKKTIRMLAESESKISQRFLQTDCRFGKEAIDIWQRECRSRCGKKEKTEAYFKYLDWKESEKEIALFTMYAYADFKIPKKFSCIFDFRNPERHCESKMELTQSIWEGWYPIDYIDHGHKHLTIFRFEEEIPNLILELHQEKQKFSSVPKNSLMLGICQIKDYQTIKKYLLSVNELRKMHGADWYDFYEEEEK